MQLLLAVRLAFAAEAERGTKLPLVLDEALSTTDPVRFRAVIECLTALVSQGGQVFYLTCQPGDAGAWNEVADEQGFAEAKVFDLAKVRALDAPAGQLLSDSAAKVEGILAPEGRSLAQYASELNVPAFDPAQGAAGLHVAHVLDQAQQLRCLLQAGICRYGQLEALMARRHADAYLDPDAARRAAARGKVVRALCDAWKIGRGRPVTREALEEAGVSATFIDRIADLSQDLDCDAARLVAALEAREDERAKGFRSAALSEVCENLEAAGYLDPREPLDREAARTRALTAVNDAVKDGAITVEEVRSVFDRFWSAATGA
jgi:DNA repair protein SbcC/Rad50